MAFQERRTQGDPETRDRRVVPRIAHPTLRDSVQQIRFWAIFMFWFLVACGAGRVIWGLTRDPQSLARSIFEAVICGLFATTLFSYSKALKAYLQLETPATLTTCFEKQRNFWMVLGLGTVILIITTAILSI